jgi:Tfp pilus assembly protein PilF
MTRDRSGFLSVLVPLCLLFQGCASIQSVKRDPAVEAQNWVALAEAALNDQDPTGALQALARAEALSSDLASVHHLRALAFLSKSDLNTAFVSARRAHELAPRDSAIATTFGKILIDLQKLSEAERVLLPAARDPLYRDAFKARTNLGVLNFIRGDLATARFHFDRAIQEVPEQACVAYHLRGQLFMKQGKRREAIQDFERSTQRLCGGYAEAEVTLGSALISDRQFDRARKKFLEIRQRFPGTRWAEMAMDRLRDVP